MFWFVVVCNSAWRAGGLPDVKDLSHAVAFQHRHQPRQVVGVEKLHRLAETQVDGHRRYKGFNLFSEEDTSLFRLLLRGEFAVNGFANRNLRQYLPRKNSAQITRLLKRL